MQSLLARAEALQSYHRCLGVLDGFQHDLQRRTQATRANLRDVARAVLGRARIDLRILPALVLASDALEAPPDQRAAALPVTAGWS